MWRQSRKLRVTFLALSLSLTTLAWIPEAQAALSVGTNSGNYQSTTGGGTLTSAACPSNGVLSGVGGQTTDYEVTGTYKATLTQLTGTCAALNADGQSIASVTTGALGPYGSSAGTALTAAACGSANGTQVIVGARLFKTSTNSFAGGVTLLCGTLPLGGSRTYGASLGATSGSYEDIACATGSVASGLYVNQGGILDKFGISCAPIINIPQSITVSLGSTSAATYPYSQVLSMSTSGSRGTGSITYALSGGTATSCTLSSSASNATLTAASSGTCTITASITSDTNYVAATSASATFTFSQAGQTALTLTSTTGNFGTTLTLTTSGGTGTGAVSFTTSPGTTTCTVSTNTLTASGSGTCSVTATKASDVNYSAISSSATTVTFSQGTSTLSLSVAAGNFVYREAKLLTAISNAPGRVTFRANNILIPGCRNLAVNSGNSYTATCNYRTAVHGALKITAALTPTSASYNPSANTTPVYYTSARISRR
jgi:hypothetical protein